MVAAARRWPFVVYVLLGACNRTPTSAATQGSPQAERKEVSAQPSNPRDSPAAASGRALAPADLEGPRQASKALGERLKAALAQAMAEQGPVEAIAVCNIEAPTIAGALSTDGRTVGRTALKVRNPKNRPDPWERRILERFAREVVQGAAPGTLEHAEIVPTDAGPTLRYMKGIGTEEVCLVCHGSELAPSVAQRIAELYPEDRATGFAPGDLRGAFTVTQALSASSQARAH